MSEHLRLICKLTRRAADVEGDIVIYGRMTPDIVRFNCFWSQTESDPFGCAVAWIRRAHVELRGAPDEYFETTSQRPSTEKESYDDDRQHRE